MCGLLLNQLVYLLYYFILLQIQMLAPGISGTLHCTWAATAKHIIACTPYFYGQTIWLALLLNTYITQFECPVWSRKNMLKLTKWCNIKSLAGIYYSY